MLRPAPARPDDIAARLAHGTFDQLAGHELIEVLQIGSQVQPQDQPAADDIICASLRASTPTPALLRQLLCRPRRAWIMALLEAKGCEAFRYVHGAGFAKVDPAAALTWSLVEKDDLLDLLAAFAPEIRDWSVFICEAVTYALLIGDDDFVTEALERTAAPAGEIYANLYQIAQFAHRMPRTAPVCARIFEAHYVPGAAQTNELLRQALLHDAPCLYAAVLARGDGFPIEPLRDADLPSGNTWPGHLYRHMASAHLRLRLHAAIARLGSSEDVFACDKDRIIRLIATP